MNLENMKKSLQKEYPHIMLEYIDETNSLILKNIIYSKRFDMGYSWDLHLKINDDKIIQKIYKCRTYSNLSIDYEQEIEPTKEAKRVFYKISNLLNLKENSI